MAACTSGTFLSGTDAADDLGVRIERATGIPGYRLLRPRSPTRLAMGIRRFFMITPYPWDITKNEAGFFIELGFEVTGMDTFACSHSPMIPALASSEVVAMAERHAAEIADADEPSSAVPISRRWIASPRWKTVSRSPWSLPTAQPSGAPSERRMRRPISTRVPCFNGTTFRPSRTHSARSRGRSAPL